MPRTAFLSLCLLLTIAPAAAQSCTSGDLSTTCTVSDTRVWQGTVSLNNLVVTGSIVTNGADLTIQAAGSISGSIDRGGVSSGQSGGSLVLAANGPVSLGSVSVAGAHAVIPSTCFGAFAGSGGRVDLSAPSVRVGTVDASGGAGITTILSGGFGTRTVCVAPPGHGGSVTVRNAVGPMIVSVDGGTSGLGSNGGNGGAISIAGAEGAFLLQASGRPGTSDPIGPTSGGDGGSVSLTSDSGVTVAAFAAGGTAGLGDVAQQRSGRGGLGGSIRIAGADVVVSGASAVSGAGSVGNTFFREGGPVSLDAGNLTVTGPVSAGPASGPVSVRTAGLSLRATVTAPAGDGRFCAVLPGHNANNWLIGGVPTGPSLRQDPGLCAGKTFPDIVNGSVSSVVDAASRSPSRLRPRLQVEKNFTINGTPVATNGSFKQVRPGDLLDVTVRVRNPVPPELDGRARMANISLREIIPDAAEVVSGTTNVSFSELLANQSATYGYTLRVPEGLGALPVRTEGTYDWLDVDGINVSGRFGSDPKPFSAGCLAFTSVSGTYDSDGDFKCLEPVVGVGGW